MLWWKALHIIAVISWMAGLLYLFRLFVYHNEETEKVVKERFQVMERRLLNIITTPAGLLALISGTVLISYNFSYYLGQRWFHFKLLFVVMLLGLNGLAYHFLKTLKTTPHPYSNFWMRLLNEVPTILMIFIVLLVILKPF